MAGRWGVTIWLLAFVPALAAILRNAASSFLADGVVPVGNDSFYHARRALDAAHDLGAFYQFDKHIHAPDGSWLVWPWGYDFALAAVLRVQGMLAPAFEPLAVVACIPPILLGIALALILAVARELRLSLAASALVAIGYALYPEALFAYGLGNIDHHGTEALFVLASILLLLRWARTPETTTAPMILGVVLGLAVSVHNGLFVAQLPVVATLFVLWLLRLPLPGRACAHFAGALVGTTLLVLLPSEPFRAGFFELELLSSFHLHVASLTALAACLLAQYPRGSRFALVALSLPMLATVPLLLHLSLGLRFVSVEIPYLEAIVEAKSLHAHFLAGGIAGVLTEYSWLPLVAPMFVLGLVALGRRSLHQCLALSMFAALGFLLYIGQGRLWYFGLPGLLLAFALTLDEVLARLRAGRSVAALAATALTVLLLWPLAHGITAKRFVGGDWYYEQARPLLLKLADACERRPGIVVASPDYGHYITFHTRCDVVANNFILTEQQIAKIGRDLELLAMSPVALAQAREPVRYAFVEAPDWAMRALYTGAPVEANREARPLYRSLFEVDPKLPGMALLGEIFMRRSDGGALALFRLYEVRRDP